MVIDKPPIGRKPWKSDSTRALIEGHLKKVNEEGHLKKVIEPTLICSRSALESDYKTKNREVKRSPRRDKSRWYGRSL